MTEAIEALKAEVAKAKALAEAGTEAWRQAKFTFDGVEQAMYDATCRYQSLASAVATLERLANQAPAGDAP